MHPSTANIVFNTQIRDLERSLQHPERSLDHPERPKRPCRRLHWLRKSR